MSAGQGFVEFALCLPVFFILLLVAIQLAVVVMQYYSLISVTGETARWLAVRPDTVDADVAAHVRSNAMTLDPNRFISITPLPACTSLVGNRCTNRTAGGLVSLEVQYDVSNLLFLPTDYGAGALIVHLPRSLPPYRVSVSTE